MMVGSSILEMSGGWSIRILMILLGSSNILSVDTVRCRRIGRPHLTCHVGNQPTHTCLLLGSSLSGWSVFISSLPSKQRPPINRLD